MNKIFMVFATCLLLVGCGNDQQPDASAKIEQSRPVQLSAASSEDDKAFFSQFYPKIETACPGLKKYAGRLNFEGIERNYNTDFVFNVQDKKTLPGEWMANGHRCFFGVTKDKANVSVSKLPCKSLCLGVEVKSGSEIDTVYNMLIPLEQTIEEQMETAIITSQASKLREEERVKLDAQARKKDYQAQRNLAYLLVTDNPSEADQVASCAWRFVIMESGSKKITLGDKTNFEYACGKLGKAQREAAADQAASILAEVYGKTLRQ